MSNQNTPRPTQADIAKAVRDAFKPVTTPLNAPSPTVRTPETPPSHLNVRISPRVIVRKKLQN